MNAAHVAKKTNEVLPAVDRARRLMEVSQLIRPWIIIMLGEREKIRLISGCLYKCVHWLYLNYTLTWLADRFGCHVMVKKKKKRMNTSLRNDTLLWYYKIQTRWVGSDRFKTDFCLSVIFIVQNPWEYKTHTQAGGILLWQVAKTDGRVNLWPDVSQCVNSFDRVIFILWGYLVFQSVK